MTGSWECALPHLDMGQELYCDWYMDCSLEDVHVCVDVCVGVRVQCTCKCGGVCGCEFICVWMCARF